MNVAQCIEDYEYFAIFTQTGIREPIDGILGMSRGGNYFYMVDLLRKEGDAATLYVDKMFDDGLITERTFSFYFTL